MGENSAVVRFCYKFTFADGTIKTFDVGLDARTLHLLRPKQEAGPPWTELNFFRCPNCPLDERLHRHCPVAVNMAGLVNSFGGSISYEEADVSVGTYARTYEKHTSLQKGLSSLIGIIMVASGCPIMERLKPMVRFHLPLATEEETKYRAMSMYLLAQFFRQRHGKRPDWEMKGLLGIYEEVRTVNKGFFKRLANIKIQDASINALVILDCFAESITFSLNRDVMEEIELLFDAYFK